MINRTYIELINKKIDGVISPDENKILQQYMERTPEAEKLYNELLETEESLDRLPEIHPSENLKKRILNSIDYSRYSAKKKKNRVFSTFLFPRNKWGLIVSFSLGLVAGTILFMLMFSNPELISSFDDKDVYGTMGLTDTEVVDKINVKTEEVSGSIGILKGTDLSGNHPAGGFNHFGFDIALSSDENCTLEIGFDSDKVQFEKFTSPSINNIRLEKGIGSVSLSLSGSQRSLLILSSGESAPGVITLKILNDEKVIFEKKALIRK